MEVSGWMVRLIMKAEPLKKIEIEIKLLQRIAEYYSFPFVVFFGNEQVFKDKTRLDAYKKKAYLYDKIKEIIEDEDVKDAKKNEWRR